MDGASKIKIVNELGIVPRSCWYVSASRARGLAASEELSLPVYLSRKFSRQKRTKSDIWVSYPKWPGKRNVSVRLNQERKILNRKKTRTVLHLKIRNLNLMMSWINSLMKIYNRGYQEGKMRAKATAFQKTQAQVHGKWKPRSVNISRPLPESLK